VGGLFAGYCLLNAPNLFKKIWYKQSISFLEQSRDPFYREEVSTIEIKNILQTVIVEEDKIKPLPDDQLADMLKERGYPIASRTLAKYREQLDIPVARMRKKM
jgi:RNA polymerase sigma-54 factor